MVRNNIKFYFLFSMTVKVNQINPTNVNKKENYGEFVLKLHLKVLNM